VPFSVFAFFFVTLSAGLALSFFFFVLASVCLSPTTRLFGLTFFSPPPEFRLPVVYFFSVLSTCLYSVFFSPIGTGPFLDGFLSAAFLYFPHQLPD